VSASITATPRSTPEQVRESWWWKLTALAFAQCFASVSEKYFRRIMQSYLFIGGGMDSLNIPAIFFFVAGLPLWLLGIRAFDHLVLLECMRHTDAILLANSKTNAISI
jgi:hypothetical protein